MRNTDEMSGRLKETIERTNHLNGELSAVSNMVSQYEVINKRNLNELEEFAAQNESISDQLKRRERVNELRDQMQQDLQTSVQKLS